MKIIYNDIIPFKGFKCLNFFGLLFVRNDTSPLNSVDISHEAIHTKQMMEMLYIFFYIWYGIEYLIRYFQYPTAHQAYRNISFEREAYYNQWNENYIKERKHFVWLTKYLKK